MKKTTRKRQYIYRIDGENESERDVENDMERERRGKEMRNNSKHVRRIEHSFYLSFPHSSAPLFSPLFLLSLSLSVRCTG
jgi:hypothetical protein